MLLFIIKAAEIVASGLQTNRNSGRGGGDWYSLLPNHLAAARARSWSRKRRGNNCLAAGPWVDDATAAGVATGNRRRDVASAHAIATCSDESRSTTSTDCERDTGEQWLCAKVRGAERFGSGRQVPRLRSCRRTLRERATTAQPAMAVTAAQCRSRPARGHGPWSLLSRRRSQRSRWIGQRARFPRAASGKRWSGQRAAPRWSCQRARWSARPAGTFSVCQRFCLVQTMKKSRIHRREEAYLRTDSRIQSQHSTWSSVSIPALASVTLLTHVGHNDYE